MERDTEWEAYKQDDDQPPHVDFAIKIGKRGASRVRLFYTRGLLEVYDRVRYDPLCDEEHAVARDYYWSFLGDAGVVVPDYCFAWDHAFVDGDALDEDGLLLELPEELMTAGDRAAFEAVHGPVPGGSESPEVPKTPETCLRTGDVEGLRGLLADLGDPGRLGELARLCCRGSASPLCLRLLLAAGAALPDATDCLSRAVERDDVATVGALLEHGGTPHDDDLFRAAQLGHRRAFEALLAERVRVRLAAAQRARKGV
jgi:hypothetical protein